MDGYNVKESLIIVLMGEGTYDDVKRRTVIEQQASAPDHHKRRGGCRGSTNPSTSFLLRE